MNKKMPWSWSRLNSFETCPSRFYHETVIKAYPFQESEAMRRGERIHKQMQDALEGKPIATEISHAVRIINKIRSVPWSAMEIESEDALRVDMTPTSWFAKDVWVRIKMDFVGVLGTKAVSYDWKTGNNYGYTDQLKLYAGYVFHKYPEVESVQSDYVYLDKKQSSGKLFLREQYQSIWDEFGDRAENINIALEKGDWPATPSSLGCKFCPVEGCKQRKK